MNKSIDSIKKASSQNHDETSLPTYNVYCKELYSSTIISHVGYLVSCSVWSNVQEQQKEKITCVYCMSNHNISLPKLIQDNIIFPNEEVEFEIVEDASNGLFFKVTI